MSSEKQAPPGPSASSSLSRLLARRHFVFGWWSVFVFGALGLTLETLHGFKVGAYLDASNETRRLMWTLAHAHGTLLGLIHLGFGLSLTSVPSIAERHQSLVSRSLVGASIFLPGGFFLGGIRFYAGDPGLGVALVPVGAALLLVGSWLLARGIPSVDIKSKR